MEQLPAAREASRPDRPPAARGIRPNPGLAAAIAGLPRTADLVFAGDDRRLRSAETLRRQLRAAVVAAEPLPIGSQARHEVIAEVLRELHDPDAAPGAVRLMFATEAAEGHPFPFSPLAARPEGRGAALRVGLMSLRHTKLDLAGLAAGRVRRRGGVGAGKPSWSSSAGVKPAAVAAV